MRQKTRRRSLAFATVQSGHLRGFNNPARLAQQYVGLDGTGDRVQHAPLRRAEVTGHVAALFLAAVDRESADLLIAGDEMVVQILADFGIGQCVRTERLGVVSGETRIFKVAGDVHHEQQFVLFQSQINRGLLVVEEQHLRPVGLTEEVRRRWLDGGGWWLPLGRR